MARHVLLTGADGYLGRAIADRLLADGVETLTLWMRAKDASSRQVKGKAAAALLATHGARVRLAFGDLREGTAFDGIENGSITHIVHCAALTRFTVARESARVVNVDGTLRVLQLARACPRLEQFVLMSSLYAAGLREGEVCEAPLSDAAGFANHYEWSKHASEERLLAASHVPGSILRVATVIADDASGAFSQRNAIHNTLRLLHAGLLPVVPGEAATPVHFITRTLAATAAARALLAGEPGAIYHAGPDATRALPLGALLESVYAVFLEDDGFRRARVLKPLLCDMDAFRRIVDGIDRFGGPVLRQALGSIAPFAPQLFRAKAFRNERLCALMDGWTDPDGESLIEATSRHLVRSLDCPSRYRASGQFALGSGPARSSLERA